MKFQVPPLEVLAGELLGILKDRVTGSRGNEDGARFCFERGHVEAI